MTKLQLLFQLLKERVDDTGLAKVDPEMEKQMMFLNGEIEKVSKGESPELVSEEEMSDRALSLRKEVGYLQEINRLQDWRILNQQDQIELAKEQYAVNVDHDEKPIHVREQLAKAEFKTETVYLFNRLEVAFTFDDGMVIAKEFSLNEEDFRRELRLFESFGFIDCVGKDLYQKSRVRICPVMFGVTILKKVG